MGLRPAHGFISSVLIFGKLVSAHLINGLTLFHLISVLYPANSAVPAILNLFSPNLAVTIFFSSSIIAWVINCNAIAFNWIYR